MSEGSGLAQKNLWGGKASEEQHNEEPTTIGGHREMDGLVNCHLKLGPRLRSCAKNSSQKNTFFRTFDCDPSES